MADLLVAMGFPREWCERALRASGGVEPAVELLLQWQADGGGPPAGGEGDLSPPRESVSAAAVSTVTNPVRAAGLDAVVPDAGGVERSRRPNAAERLKMVQEEESEEKEARKFMATAASVVASGSKFSGNMSEGPVELHIRCSGYSTMKRTFSAGATLNEVRNFVLQELETQQLQQPVGMPSSGGSNRQPRRPSRSRAVSAASPSDRVTQRAKKTSRYVDPSSNTPAPRNLPGGNLSFLIPFPRKVFDTEASMETTLCDANLFPRGILTVQFQSKENPSTSEQVNNAHEFSGSLEEGAQSRQVQVFSAQSSDHHVSRHIEEVAKREIRLKATLDRYGSRQGSERVVSGIVETRVAAASILAPSVRPSASASSRFLAYSKERSLEVDGERVRHQESALQAAAKRMTEAAQMFREGLMTNEGEDGGGFGTPSDAQPVPTVTNDEARFFSENQESKGKQVADCGPSSRTIQQDEVRMHDVGSNYAGLGMWNSRARMPLSSASPSRPEKLQRTGEATSISSAGANHNTSFLLSGHAIERTGRREAQETLPSETWNSGSPASPSVSELRIRLEDGSVLRQTFPAYTTLQSVCEFAIPGRFSTAEYGLIIPMPGSHFFEGEALNSTLQEVGLVPRGVVHLQKVASRGLVTQGRRRARRRMRHLHSDNRPEPELEQLWQDFSRHMNTNLTYEELVELEDSIGRGDPMNVGVPEATIANLPTHIVSRNAGDICIVCLSEMVEDEEVMLLPCVHTFHPACIRQWLLQSTYCPTCKHYIT